MLTELEVLENLEVSVPHSRTLELVALRDASAVIVYTQP